MGPNRWRSAFGDEELRAIRVRTRIRKSQSAWQIKLQAGCIFVFKGIAGTALTIRQRIASLNHEISNHAVKGKSIVERFALFLGVGDRIAPFLGTGGQADEVVHRGGNFVLEEFAGEIPWQWFR